MKCNSEGETGSVQFLECRESNWGGGHPDHQLTQLQGKNTDLMKKERTINFLSLQTNEK